MRDNEIATFEFYKERDALFSDSTGKGIYYCAQENKDANGTSWSIVRRTLDYHHSWRRWVTFHSDETIVERIYRLPEAMEMLAKFEKELQQKKGYEQKKMSFHVHYRDYIAEQGDYLDENGKYVAVGRCEPVMVDAKMDNSKLSSLYKQAAEKAEVQGIQTWEDFHRAVTGKIFLYSKEKRALSIDSDFAQCGEDMLQHMAMLDRVIADDSVSLWTRKFAVDDLRKDGVEYEKDDGLEYHYFAMRLTALVRAGQKVCAAFVASPMTESHLRILEHVTDAVRNIDGARFGFTPEMAAQATNLFTQGPDPRTGTASPFEEVLRLRAAARGKGPKPYSP